MESIFEELAAAGLARLPPPATVDEFLGGDWLARPPPPPSVPLPGGAKPKAGGKKSNSPAKPAAAAEAGPGGKAGAGGKGKGGAAGGSEPGDYPEPSLAQARQAVVASCILPLGAHPALARCSCREAGGRAWAWQRGSAQRRALER